MPVHLRPAHRSFPRALRAALILSLSLLCLPSAAAAATPTKTVSYDGYTVRVPRSWPVYHLSAAPGTCVRFNRHAVYLGAPGANQSCPVQAIGRTEAILIERSSAGSPLGLDGSGVTRRVDHRAGVSAIGTWNRDPAVIQRALGFRTRRAMTAAAPGRPSPARTATATAAQPQVHAAATRTTTAVSTPGEIYTGKGFDVCSTPSTKHMTAWNTSPYRAIGVYIGGTNRACSQPNLTTTWVTAESNAGWHVIPIYVGLQAPSNGCGCSPIKPSSAAAEGKAAAGDAVAQAQAVGMGTGNPLYFDMEGYTRTTANTHAVLAFLQAWTEQLHADGYLSGIYSSGGSGITDLAAQWGTAYVEPDELWFADWNGKATTTDSYVPSSEWVNHQRLHQYSGGVNQTYGGVKLNIDQDYLNAATAAAGSGASASSAPPADTTVPAITGNAYAGQRLRERHGIWSGSPTSYAYQWYQCDSTGASCAVISGATAQSYVVPPTEVGDTIRVTETASNTIGSGPAATSQQTAGVRAAPTSSYWLYTAFGNVYNALGSPFYGSASRRGVSTMTGMARTPDGRGYWMVDAAGQLFHYGDAAAIKAVAAPHRVIGIAAAPRGGLYAFTAYGNVDNLGVAKFYGSPRASGRRVSTITGMAVTPDGRGYWLVNAAGRVFSYGDAARLTGVTSTYPVHGIVAARGGGIWLWTTHGNVDNLGGAPFYGSPVAQRHRTTGVTGFARTKDGRGYWLVQSGGKVLSYGNAEPLPAITPAHPIIGLS